MSKSRIPSERPIIAIQLNDSYKPVLDGVAVCTENYARGLNNLGIPAAVAAPWSPEGDGRDEFPVFRYTSLPIPLWKPYRAGVPDFDPMFRQAFWTWVGQYAGAEIGRPYLILPRGMVQPLRIARPEPDRMPAFVIHCHAPFASATLARRIRNKLRRAGIPAFIVATMHTKFHLDLRRGLPETIVNQVLRVIRRQFEAADQVWSLNPGTLKTLRSYGYEGPVEIVSNGCDFDPPDDAEYRKMRRAGRQVLSVQAGLGEFIPSEEPVMLFVGRLSLQKNISLILESLAGLDARSPDQPWKMVFVGDGSDRAAISRLVHKLGLQRRVVFLGRILDRDRLAEQYAAADLFVFPSVYDNDPLVVREAAAFRTPAILAAGSDASTGTVDGRNSFHVEPEREPLVAMLARLVDPAQKQLVQEVGDAASREVYRSWETAVKEVARRYRDLVRERTGDLAP